MTRKDIDRILGNPVHTRFLKKFGGGFIYNTVSPGTPPVYMEQESETRYPGPASLPAFLSLMERSLREGRNLFIPETDEVAAPVPEEAAEAAPSVGNEASGSEGGSDPPVSSNDKGRAKKNKTETD